LREARLQVPLPPLADKTHEYEAFKKALSEASRARQALLEVLADGAAATVLPADHLLRALWKNAQRIQTGDALAAASQRKQLGNPPGKGGSLGDAVNWELLLAHVPQETDLCFVSADSDFASPLDPDRANEYLADEWSGRKKSQLFFFRSIENFLDAKYPAIRLASDVKKYFLIEELIASPSFADSHRVVAELMRYDTFSLAEAERILTGGMENSQVRWLAEDEDVHAFLQRLITPHRNALSKSLVARWEFLMAGQGYFYGPAPTDADVEKFLKEIGAG
jgi:hypothetical protein